MPNLYLVLDDGSGLIAAQNTVPLMPYTDKRTHMQVFANMVDIWCKPATTSSVFNSAVELFSARIGRLSLIRDVNSAVQQLQQLVGKAGCGYIALGGSPKLVKWALKARGFNVCTVNASKVTEGTARTQEFENYLERKLQKLGAPGTIAVVDFADTGASLRQIKADVQSLRNGTQVLAVALGGSPAFHKDSNVQHRAGIDHVLVGIDTLQDALQKQTLKLYVLGRNKEKNDYVTWSDQQSRVLDNSHVIGNKLSNTALFQQQKQLLPRALDLPEMNVNLNDLMDIAGSDDDYDY